MWGRRIRGSVGGWLIHLKLLRVGHWEMYDSKRKGCKE